MKIRGYVLNLPMKNVHITMNFYENSWLYDNKSIRFFLQYSVKIHYFFKYFNPLTSLQIRSLVPRSRKLIEVQAGIWSKWPPQRSVNIYFP